MNHYKMNIISNDEKSPFEQNISYKPVYTKVLVTSKKKLKPERITKLSEEHKKNKISNDLNSLNYNHSTNFESNTPEQLKKNKRIEKIENDFRNCLTNQANKSSKRKIYTNNPKFLKEKERVKTMVNKIKNNNRYFMTKRKYLLKTDFHWNNSVDSQNNNNNITTENMKSKYSKSRVISDFNIGINILNNYKYTESEKKNTSRSKKLNKEKFENLFLRVKNLLNNYENIVKYYQKRDHLSQNKQ